MRWSGRRHFGLKLNEILKLTEPAFKVEIELMRLAISSDTTNGESNASTAKIKYFPGLEHTLKNGNASIVQHI